MIEIEHLRKAFGPVEAVSGVSFTARDGEITGLLGPNGAGKTTTLRMLYTLLSPDAGTIRIDGIDAERDRLTARRHLGVLPDARGLYKRLTARENIEYFARLHGLRGRALRAQVDAMIDLLGMEDIADRRAEGFSQGQRVKVALARALVHEPRNLILDEPGNGLDVMATRALRDFLREKRKAGHCVLFSSHMMQEVTVLCDSIVVIASGRVVAEGTADTLRERTGAANLEDAFVSLIGTGEGLAA